jgi:hypothetical protein
MGAMEGTINQSNGNGLCEGEVGLLDHKILLFGC